MTGKMILEHLFIVGVSVVFTVLMGIPLGVCAYLFPKIRKVLLFVVEVLQTIPAMAMLGIIMVFMGAGKPTVMIGLVLYSLLPVVQNTYLGLNEVDAGIKEVAAGMGMTRMYRLLHIELPIAFPFIFTGVRIAAVTAVGVAVFASFVGGGGLGGVIYRAINIQNMRLIVASTLVLMLMAVALDWLMTLLERHITSSRHLR